MYILRTTDEMSATVDKKITVKVARTSSSKCKWGRGGQQITSITSTSITSDITEE